MFDYSDISPSVPSRIVVPYPGVTALVIVTGCLDGNHDRLPQVVNRIRGLLVSERPPAQSRQKQLAVLLASEGWLGQQEMGHCERSQYIREGDWDDDNPVGSVMNLPGWQVIWGCGRQAPWDIKTSYGAIKTPLVHPASSPITWRLWTSSRDGFHSPCNYGRGYSDEVLVAQVKL